MDIRAVTKLSEKKNSGNGLDINKIKADFPILRQRVHDNRRVYLDNAAATRMDEKVLEAMKPYFFDTYAVATSEFGYSQGIEAREALGEAREALASSMGATPEEFIFTSGSTESCNTALKGTALALGEKKGKHVNTLQAIH